jgi:cell wall assembly regulator SMI1
MDPIEAIGASAATTFEPAPPLSDGEIASLEAELGHRLPHDLRRLLEHTGAIAGAPLELDFTGRTMDIEVHELFPAGVPIAHDGAGNFWIVDTNPDDLADAPVFYACHDAPIVLYQSNDVGDFLHEVFRKLDGEPSLVDDVHEDRLSRVWQESPGTIDHSSALAGDPDLSAFATRLDDRWTFVDLRSPQVGMGFAWGRHGPRTEVRRHGYQRLVAYALPERKPGLLGRLFASR